MSLKTLTSFVLFALVIHFFTACQSDKGNVAEKVLGRWEISEAFRDGQQTGTLDELYFEFMPSGQMRTNLSGEEETAGYEVSGDIIQQRESRIEADYQVLEVTDSTLELTTELRDYRFRFLLKKTN